MPPFIILLWNLILVTACAEDLDHELIMKHLYWKICEHLVTLFGRPLSGWEFALTYTALSMIILQNKTGDQLFPWDFLQGARLRSMRLPLTLRCHRTDAGSRGMFQPQPFLPWRFHSPRIVCLDVVIYIVSTTYPSDLFFKDQEVISLFRI